MVVVFADNAFPETSVEGGTVVAAAGTALDVINMDSTVGWGVSYRGTCVVVCAAGGGMNSTVCG